MLWYRKISEYAVMNEGGELEVAQLPARLPARLRVIGSVLHKRQGKKVGESQEIL